MAGRWRGGGPWWSVGLRHDDRQVAVGPRRVVRRPRLRGLRTNGQNLPLRFQVAVQPGTTGGITYTQTSVASGAVLHTARVLTVTPSGSGWRFVKPN